MKNKKTITRISSQICGGTFAAKLTNEERTLISKTLTSPERPMLDRTVRETIERTLVEKKS